MMMTEIETQSISGSNSGSGNGSGDSKVIREDVLQCLSRKNKYYRVVLTSSEILLQLQGGTNQRHHHHHLRHHQQTIERYSIEDLFGCHTLRHKHNGPSFASAYVCFYLYPRRRRVLLSKAKLREKAPLVFEVRKTGCTYEENLALATKWKEDALKILTRKYPKWENNLNLKIQDPSVSRANGRNGHHSNGNAEDVDISRFEMSNGKNQSLMEGKLGNLTVSMMYARKYLVVVNPVSGQGKGVSTFHEKIHPVLLEAGVKVDLLVTQHSGHAKEVVSTADLAGFDGIVTVGGDGLLYEVVNGLRGRSDIEKVANIPVGAIATGSGNGLARSLAHYGRNDLDYLKNPVLTSTLAIARGKVIPVNLLDVYLDGKKISAFLSVGWGLMADIDIESEVLRAIGEPRFTVWGLYRLAKLRFYKAQLSYIPCEKIFRDEVAAANSITLRPRDPVAFEGEFISVYSSCQSYIGSDLIFAPAAKPGDGLIHLTYLTKEAGRGAATQFLLGMEKGNHLNVNGVSYVTVKEFSIRSRGGIGGHVTVDGENVTGEEIRVRVSPIPLNVFTL